MKVKNLVCYVREDVIRKKNKVDHKLFGSVIVEDDGYFEGVVKSRGVKHLLLGKIDDKKINMYRVSKGANNTFTKYNVDVIANVGYGPVFSLKQGVPEKYASCELEFKDVVSFKEEQVNLKRSINEWLHGMDFELKKAFIEVKDNVKLDKELDVSKIKRYK